jgi:hypothetical protein
MTGHSSETICVYIKHLHQLIAENVKEQDCILGGPGVIVEMDECKIAKLKHHRGHPVEGAWVIGAVERTSERRFFCQVVESRDAVTINAFIERRMLPGTLLYTDRWRGYSDISSLGIQHSTVNHSLFFKDPITGVHTNTIEGTWAGLKSGIPVRNRTKGAVEKDILSFIWRRQNEGRLWTAFIEALRGTMYV